MPATCAFCAIIVGEAEAAVILETERLVAFLDHRPLFRGHTLLVPRLHVRLLSDLPADQVLAAGRGHVVARGSPGDPFAALRLDEQGE